MTTKPAYFDDGNTLNSDVDRFHFSIVIWPWGLAPFVAEVRTPPEWRDRVRASSADLIGEGADVNMTANEALRPIGPTFT